VEWAIDGGVFTAGALLEWLSRDLGLAADPASLVAAAREVQDAGGVRVLPALAGLGAPWWRPSAHAVIAGLTAGARTGHVARAARPLDEPHEDVLGPLYVLAHETHRPSSVSAPQQGDEPLMLRV